MNKIEKVFSHSVKQAPGNDPRILRFVASTEDVDRDGDVVEVSGWQLEEWNKNPVILFSHNYSDPPIARGVRAEKDLRNKQLVIDARFPTMEELSPSGQPSEYAKRVETIYQMYLLGLMNATSVGFAVLDSEKIEDSANPNMPDWLKGNRIKKANLMELSCVSVPANPNALIQARSIKSLDQNTVSIIEKAYIEEKSAIPYKKYPLADEDTKWDAGKIVADSTVEDLAIICTWKADKKPEDITKGDYKLPHHLGKADGFKLVKAGVIAAVGALRGARGGVDIPEADKPGVEKHLKKHYEDLSLDWPEDKDAWVAQAKAFGIDTEEAKSIEPIVTKEGRRLSAATLAMIDSFGDCIKELDESIAACKSTRDKLAVKIDELRSGASSEEPEEPMEEPEDEDIEKSFVIELVE